jgi:hypothetical protein
MTAEQHSEPGRYYYLYSMVRGFVEKGDQKLAGLVMGMIVDEFPEKILNQRSKKPGKGNVENSGDDSDQIPS